MQINVEDTGHEDGIANLEPPGIGIPDQLRDDVVARDLVRSAPGHSCSNPTATSWLHQMSLIARPWPEAQMSHIWPPSGGGQLFGQFGSGLRHDVADEGQVPAHVRF